jgi:hypothetical protein
MANVGAVVRSQKGTLSTANEHERDAAWRFTAFALAGEFRTRGCLGVLYTPEFVSGDGSRSQWWWLSLEELEKAAIEGGPERWWPPLAFLDRCWVSSERAEKWKVAHGPSSDQPGLSQPDNAAGQVGVVPRGKAGGRKRAAAKAAYDSVYPDGHAGKSNEEVI